MVSLSVILSSIVTITNSMKVKFFEYDYFRCEYLMPFDDMRIVKSSFEKYVFYSIFF